MVVFLIFSQNSVLVDVKMAIGRISDLMEREIVDDVFPFLDKEMASCSKIELIESNHYWLMSVGFPELWGELKPGKVMCSYPFYTPMTHADSEFPDWQFGTNIQQFFLIRTDASEFDFHLIEFNFRNDSDFDIPQQFMEHGYSFV